MNTNFEYYVPQHLIFGSGSFNQLGTMKLPGKKALIITTEDRLFLDRTIQLLEQNGAEYIVYDKIRPNPCTDDINEGARWGVDNNCDFVLAVGGGSPMDAAKCIAMLMYDDAEYDIWDYVQYREGHRVPRGCLPMILVSTTAGTGSEVVPGGVVSNDHIDVKLDVGNPLMFPTYSIVDPELQVSVPPFLTAVQGFDVIFHCIEGYLNQFHTPYSDMVYMAALEYANTAIEVAYRDSQNIEARINMALASNLAGIGETLADVISLHAMAHTLGSFHHELPHGVGLALLVPEAFELYCTYPTKTRQRMAHMAQMLGYGDAPEDLVHYISDKLKAMDLYYIDYTEYGIDESRCAEYARHTVVEIAPYMDKDEHTLTADEVEQVFRKSFTRHKQYLLDV